MQKIILPLGILLAAILQAADPQSLVITSAASTTVGVAPDGLASIFGDSISTMNLSAGAPPWPTRLGDISTVNISDSGGHMVQAGILFTSPGQMNIYGPAGLASGAATIQFPVTGLPPGVGTAALRSVQVNLQKVAPALFSAAGTGTGVAAATAVRRVIATQIDSAVPIFFCSQPGNCSPIPIDLGIDAPIYVSLFGTGIRNASSVTVTVGTTTVQPLYVGPQGQYPGLDQINFGLPLSLRGAGMVKVTVTADGVASNSVQLSIQ